MADTDGSENQKSKAEQSTNNSDPSKFDATKPNTLKSLISPKFGKAKFGLPKLGFHKFKLPKPQVSFKTINFLWLWLAIILLSYSGIGYFLSVLLTIPSRRDLAIAGFVILGLLPIISAFADYALIKWGYLISGVLVISGLFFLVRLESYLVGFAAISWVGPTAITFVGDFLIKERKFWTAIGILTSPCFIGFGIGHLAWRLATQLS